MPSENYNSQFDRLSRIQETKDLEEAIGAAIATIQAQVKVPVALDKEWKHFEIQQICSETGGWEQITPINRFLRTASVTREKLLAATHQYLVLDSILRIKSKGSKASPVLDIKSENIRRTVEKALKNLDNNISDIECDLVLAERTVSTEKGGLVGIKNQLARIEQRLIAMTPNLQRLEHSPPLAPIEGTSKGDDAPGTSQEGPARLTEKEIDDDEYPALLCAETVKVQESTNTDKSIVMEPETSTGRKGPVMEKNNKTEPITAGTSSSSIKTKKKHLHVENTQDQAIQALEKDLDDLREIGYANFASLTVIRTEGAGMNSSLVGIAQ
ncbi:hypothetical protein RB195_024579 [Necator americanus]|uniref:Uncharacterized protein n=1 Tax=Necator americanus TaxID=51031 RepID=A0ABR1EPE7_NECAM